MNELPSEPAQIVEAPKVLVCISGGVLQSAYARDPNIRVELVDHDDLGRAGALHALTGEDVEAVAAAGLHPIEPQRITADDTHPGPMVVASLSPTPVLYDYATDRQDAAIKAAKANAAERDERTWSPMTQAAFEEERRRFYLDQPLREVTPKEFHEQLGMAPPHNQLSDGPADRFIVGEAQSGSIFRQHALLNGRAFWRYVDANDKATWITAGEIAAHCAGGAGHAAKVESEVEQGRSK